MQNFDTFLKSRIFGNAQNSIGLLNPLLARSGFHLHKIESTLIYI